jgi:hypothetical protein
MAFLSHFGWCSFGTDADELDLIPAFVWEIGSQMRSDDELEGLVGCGAGDADSVEEYYTSRVA